MAESADAPLDEIDDAILNELAAVNALVDPPPADLDDRVRFAIALENIDVEVARLSEDMPVGSGARTAEQPRTITFDSRSLTIMITVLVRPDGRRRVDGWLAPAAPLRVELRTGGARAGTHVVTADEGGRFVVDGVPPGLVQVVVSEIGPDRRTVATTAVLI